MTISMDNIRYTIDGYEYDYEPRNYVGTLDWFNIAKCARERMTENANNVHRWRGERRSFYSSIQKMEVDHVHFMD